MRYIAIFALLFCLSGCGGSGPGDQTITPGTPSAGPTVAPTPSISSQLDTAIQTTIAQGLPGAIVSIRGNNFQYEKAFGLANTATGAPMRTDMVMRIGSITKTFTVTAILQLVDAGKVGLDDPISKYVSGVPSGDQITLRQLAAMQSGLFNFTNDENWANALAADQHRHFSTQELLGYAFSHPNVFPPGTDFEYCNTNTVLLGEVVEKVSGKTLDAFIQENICQPLGLTQTALPPNGFLPDPHANGYTQKFTPGVTEDATTWDPSWAGAAGAMYSNIDSLQIWGLALGTGSLLSTSTQTARLQFVPFKEGPPNSTYGLGIINMSGWIGHGGNLPGYNSLVAYLPSLQMTLVVLTNTDTAEEGAFQPNLLIAHDVTAIITPQNVIAEALDPE